MAKNKQKDLFYEELVEDVKQDFSYRQKESNLPVKMVNCRFRKNYQSFDSSSSPVFKIHLILSFSSIIP